MPVNISLSDSVVTLRPFQSFDVTAYFNAVNESLEMLMPWMSWAHPRYGETDAADYIRIVRNNWDVGTQYAFAITDAQYETLLGAVSLSHIHPVYHFCNLGYWIRTSRRGQGLAGRAARLTARFAFEQIGLVRVEVVVAADNAASLTVAEKIGAHREGVLRNRVIVRQTVHDAVMFSLTPADFGLDTIFRPTKGR